METIINGCIDILMVFGIVCVFCTPIVIFGYCFEKYVNKHPKVFDFINKFWED